MTVAIRTHGDTQKRRQRQPALWGRSRGLRVVLAFLLMAGIGVAVWSAGWSPLFAVTDIPVTGSTTLDEAIIGNAVGYGRSLVRTDTDALATRLLQEFPVIASVSVTRDWPHTLTVSITERQPAGIWCRADTCRLFDRTGVRWGSALPSRGTLLISVRDERPSDAIEPRLLSGLLATVDGLTAYHVRPMLITLPDQAPGDLVVTTDRAYTLVLDALGDIADQLDTLGILLAQHASDTTFTPTNIDLRTPGRIFYR